jgi:arsenate reductase
MPAHYNVLFLCTANSSRSIMAEAMMNRLGRAEFTAYSAGSRPAGVVRAEALKQLSESGISTECLRSKSWEEFAAPGAPQMDFIFTVCDDAANESCPLWPGHPATAHWGIPDPARVHGTPAQIERAYDDAFVALERRINLFLALPHSTIDQLAMQQHLEEIGRA